MTLQEHFHLFVENNTRRRDMVTPCASYKERYGDMSFEDAFQIHWKDVQSFLGLKAKIDKFEVRLKELGAIRTQSNISESRYYQYDGCTFRFSSHVYPTGSMTNEMLKIYDFAANPELINKFVK